ncbi:MAG: ribosome recycling factor [Gemmatimonadetes bacterium]|nr:ribosome recycling factor [Gemmatimonadota bacterium]
MIDEIMAEARTAMQKSVIALQNEMGTVRTGRANAHLLDQIRVEYYGTQMPINQVATVGVPEPRLIALQPWDKSAIPLIEKAILESNLGLTPTNDGTIIRLPIPQLTEDRRREFVRVVRQYAEESRISVRNTRRDANELIRDAQKEGEIPEDDARRTTDRVQDLTDEFVAKIDEVLKEKEEEIMEV